MVVNAPPQSPERSCRQDVINHVPVVHATLTIDEITPQADETIVWMPPQLLFHASTSACIPATTSPEANVHAFVTVELIVFQALITSGNISVPNLDTD